MLLYVDCILFFLGLPALYLLKNSFVKEEDYHSVEVGLETIPGDKT